MSYISQRTVKGKKYYYLEESFQFNKVLVKESVYFGSMYPSNDEIFLGEEVLRRTCLERNHIVINPPLTQFIKNRTAGILENSKKNYLNEFSKLTKKQILAVKKKRLDSLKNLAALCNESVGEKNLDNCLKYYSKSINNNEPLTEYKIKKFHSLLQGVNEDKINENELKFTPLLFTWFKEKTDLINQVEFAAKFASKFFSLKLFEHNNLLLSIILANYILEQKQFPFVLVSKKRFPSLIKSLNFGDKENFKPITNFFAKEIVKQNKAKPIQSEK
jgi:hypothetical protein